MSMNNKFCKLSLLSVVLIKLVFYGSCCTDVEWSCDSGQCIASDDLCDGKTDCVDKSDETVDVCIQESCPSFAFRCAYGACVTGSAECDGNRDCADNSDETSSLCLNDLNKKLSTCGEEQFQCTSNQCISLDSACDGRSDCMDQSDETVDACASFNCPTFAFRCGYGACIELKNRCNGVPDCRDGSDESRKLCGQKRPTIYPTATPPTFVTVPTKPTKRPPLTPPTKPPAEGCKAPNIPNSILKYEAEPTIIIRPGETVPDGVSMTYNCAPGYVRQGPQFNLCFTSRWYTPADANCVKYCSSKNLKGVTFRAECQKDGVSVLCDDRILPGTSARLFCQQKYRKPVDRNPPDILVCQENGQWDYEPFRCEPVCGQELLLTTAFSVGSIATNITYVPWHAGIYSMHDGSKYKHVCGATIISAKVVITAAHCFWDYANEKQFDKSYYRVGAGKYLRDYYASESNAVFKNISEITIPDDFGDLESYKSDIAVLVLTNFLKFSSFIAPACIDWQQGAAKSISSDIEGRIPGWGIDDSGGYSDVLRSIDVPSTSYSDCRNKIGPEFRNAVSNDKFCVINTSGSVVCQGDSGGGFIERKFVNGRRVSYLWGVVSGGVPHGFKCSEYKFVTYTNIQYFEAIIVSRMNTNRPK